MSAALTGREHPLIQLEKGNEELRAQDRELWREIGVLESAREFHASRIAAIDEELRAVERRLTEQIEDVEQRMNTRIDRIVDAIRSNIRTVITISAVLIALAELVISWLR
jgi:chromosome segregation ATPase